jgi:hypothetical protein
VVPYKNARSCMRSGATLYASELNSSTYTGLQTTAACEGIQPMPGK